MTILSGDIVLAKSQIMDDVPEGGGAPVSAVVIDNSSNGIFNDISEIDRAGGRVNLRKLFASIRTANVDGYFGANMIVADPPLDPNVSITLFSTNDSFDTRVNAQSRIEAYLSVGASYSGLLFGDHIAGQSAIIMLQRPELELPVVGSTLVLQKNPGSANFFEQFVRITKVTSRLRTFTDQQGDFQRTEVTTFLSDPLEQDFPGLDATRYDFQVNFTGKTKIFSTVVADAARYYGIVPLTAVGHIGDFTVNASDIFTQIVPSTRVETPIADSRMNQQAAALVSAGAAFIQNINAVFTSTTAMFVGGGILPGSLSLVRGAITITDKGGTLVSNAAQVGTIDYANGLLALTTDLFGSGSGQHTITYTPAQSPIIVSESIGVPVTAANQRLTWVLNAEPIPARASLQISYRSQAHWYVLTDDGTGAVSGSDSSLGAGAINFTTGTVSVTLGALPDVGSQIIMSWAPGPLAQPASSIPASKPVNLSAQGFSKNIQLPSPMTAGSVSIAWNDGAARVSTDSNGVLGGAATGALDYSNGLIELSPNLLPAPGTPVVVSYKDAVQQKVSTPTFTDAGAAWTFNLPAPIKPGSLRMAIYGSYLTREFPGTDVTKAYVIELWDQGLGALTVTNNTGMLVVGSVDFATGAVSINKSVAGYKSLQPTFATTEVLPAEGTTPAVTKTSQSGLEIRTLQLTLLNGVTNPSAFPQTNWAWWIGSVAGSAETIFTGTDGVVKTLNTTFDQLFLKAVTGINDPSATPPVLTRFSLGTAYHFTQGTDILTGLIPASGQGTKVGSVGTQATPTGSLPGILLTTWPSGVSPIPTNQIGATAPPVSGDNTPMLISTVTFRTAISPLFNGGFTISGTMGAGAGENGVPTPGLAFNVTADANGNIDSTSVAGKVDYDSGVVTLSFRKQVPLQPIGTYQLAGVQADTLRYNAVGFSYIPLDASILGLNPVRLPPDGRVPIFKPGSFAVLGNTATVGPLTPANGQVIDLGRVRLSRARVIGSDNAVINVGYTVDLEAGLLTVVDKSTWAQPVTIEHRVEDTVLVSDAQINGQITFTRPLTHAYPLGSFISSAIVAGDMHARVSLTFDQQTWSNVFSDTIVGSPATGTFDTISHPITITNAGGLTERWAIVFTSSNAFNVIGEHVGVIAVGTTNSDLAPLNPATNAPYFNVPFAGWGLGWVPGNVLRFNTVGAEFPLWVIRTIQQGPATVDGDRFQLAIRGDVDNP